MATYKGLRTRNMTKQGGWGSTAGGPLMPPTKMYDGPARYGMPPPSKNIDLPKSEYKWAQRDADSPQRRAMAAGRAAAAARRIMRKGMWYGAKAAFQFSPWGRGLNILGNIMDAIEMSPWAMTTPAGAEIPGHYDFPAAGFTLNCKLPWDPAPVPPFLAPGWAFQFYAAAGPGCSATAFVPFAALGGAPMTLPSSRRTVGLGPLRNIVGTRYTHTETWTRPTNSPGLVIPWVAPQPGTPAVVVPLPQDPWPNPGNPTREYPRAETDPKPKTPTIRVPPGGGIVRTPEKHKYMPPGPRVRERKKTLSAGLVGKLYGGITEVGDAVQAIASAIPGKPCRNLPLHEKVQCLARNWDRVNWAKAAFNLAIDQMQDRAIGKISGAADKGFRSAFDHGYAPNRPVGPGSGSWNWHPDMEIKANGE